MTGEQHSKVMTGEQHSKVTSKARGIFNQDSFHTLVPEIVQQLSEARPLVNLVRSADCRVIEVSFHLIAVPQSVSLSSGTLATQTVLIITDISRA